MSEAPGPAERNRPGATARTDGPVLDDALRTGKREVTHYDGAVLRARFRGRLTLRRGSAHVRTPAAAAAAFTLLRTPFGRAAAARVLFGDRSFPSPHAGEQLTTQAR